MFIGVLNCPHSSIGVKMELQVGPWVSTAIDISCLPRPYLPSKRDQTGSLSAGSWSFSQHQFLAASHLGPLLQLLFSWFAELSVILM